MDRLEEKITPNFSMSYAKLIQLGDKSILNIERDKAMLLPYGITPEWVVDLSDKIVRLKNTKTDEELMYDVSLRVETRNATRESITDKLRTIIIKAQNTFPAGKARYRLFAVGALDSLKVENFYRISKRIWRAATGLLDDFGNKITQQELDDLNTEIVAYDSQIEDVEAAIQHRSEATEDRLELANQIYSLVTEAMDYGKDYWRDRNEAKHNDYIIYGSKSNTQPPPTVEKNRALDTTNFFFENDFTDTTTLLPQIGMPVIEQASKQGAIQTYVKATNATVASVRITKSYEILPVPQ